MNSLRQGCSAAILLLLTLGFAAESSAQTKFVVLGDMPYRPNQIGSLGYISSQVPDTVPFFVHYGDLKAGDEPCDDDLLKARKTLLRGLKDGALFYTPGDNDWTDCDRPAAGGFDERERLAFLRDLFFTDGMPSNPNWHIARQLGYPENARWRLGGVQFATLHIVGSDNGRSEILQSDVSAALDAVDARDAANLIWLDTAFEQASAEGSEGLVLFMQADPGELDHRDSRSVACSAEERTRCNPYRRFLQRLTERADAFDKPVLLVHGSTNKFCLDRGFGGWQAKKLWRLNGPGDFVTIDGAIVSFDTAAPQPFAVRGVLSEIAPPDCQGR